jgi:hypothetical protein
MMKLSENTTCRKITRGFPRHYSLTARSSLCDARTLLYMIMVQCEKQNRRQHGIALLLRQPFIASQSCTSILLCAVAPYVSNGIDVTRYMLLAVRRIGLSVPGISSRVLGGLLLQTSLPHISSVLTRPSFMNSTTDIHTVPIRPRLYCSHASLQKKHVFKLAPTYLR